MQEANQNPDYRILRLPGLKTCCPNLVSVYKMMFAIIKGAWSFPLLQILFPVCCRNFMKLEQEDILVIISIVVKGVRRTKAQKPLGALRRKAHLRHGLFHVRRTIYIYIYSIYVF